MPITVVVGTQWGDEGKGKCVDVLAAKADAVVRFQGGNNAGHTLVVGGTKTVLHLIPSGALYDEVDCYLTRGVVIHPRTLLDEIRGLAECGISVSKRLFISQRAPLIMPWHLELDAAREGGEGAIGTTKRGIGPCYEQFAARQAIVAGDLLDPDRAVEKIERFYAERLAALKSLAREHGTDVDEYASVSQAVERFRRNYDDVYTEMVDYVCDVESILQRRIRNGDDLVLEGAQGTFLDVGMGTYPFVTSSHTTAAGACTGAGIAPRDLDSVVGICKAYTTRVGDGPMPTELDEDSAVGKHLREVGHEFGATTGRPRRCGWLDLNLLRRAVEINGCEKIVLTKLDVLSGLDELLVATDYDDDGQPIYETLPGWSQRITGVRHPSDLPSEARDYVQFIEDHIEALSCRIHQVSVGPDRDQIFSLRQET